MKEQLIHILDQSVCLSRKQMKEYLSGSMLPEEAHAAEVHLSSCALCSLAMEGFEEHSEQALAAISALNSGFLKEHFDNISPQIHLNSIAHTAALPAVARKSISLQPVWRRVAIAAAAMLLIGLVWAFQHNRNPKPVPVREIVVNSSSPSGAVGASTPATSAVERPVTAASIPPKAETPAGKSATPVVKQDVKVTPVPEVSDKQPDAPLPAKVAAVASPKPAAPDTDVKATEEPAARSHAASAEKESVPVVKEKTAPPVQPAETKDDIERGDESYGKGSYGAALAHYKKGMASTDSRTRYQSMLMAAQCYAALGNKAKAETLLQRVIDEGSGPERRAAKRALRRMN